MKKLTVGQLKKALENVPDELEIELESDSGVDDGPEEIVVNEAHRVNYTSLFGVKRDYFAIFADYVDELEEEE